MAKKLGRLNAGVKQAVQCDNCILKGRTKVWGEGDENSPIIFVGQCPGATEERLHRPFVGPAGERLDTVFKDAGLPRKKVWLTNLVKCATPPGVIVPYQAVECCRAGLVLELKGRKLVVTVGGDANASTPIAFGQKKFSLVHPAAALRQGIYEVRLRKETLDLRKELIDANFVAEDA